MDKQSFRCGTQCVVHRGMELRLEVLLGLRYNTAYSGHWALPGGHVERGETFAETAMRELREETGLVMKPQAIASPFISWTPPIPFVHAPVFFGVARDVPRVMPDEHFSELDYFPISALPEPLFEPSRIAIERFQSYRLRVAEDKLTRGILQALLATQVENIHESLRREDDK